MTDALINPAHPGILIRDEVLPSFGLDQGRAADVLRTARPGFNNLLNGKRAMTPEMALKIEAAFGVSASLLLNAQANYDLAEARKRAADITAGVERQTLAAA